MIDAELGLAQFQRLLVKRQNVTPMTILVVGEGESVHARKRVGMVQSERRLA